MRRLLWSNRYIDITTDRQLVAASFLNQHLWYGVLTDLMGLQILAENGVAISNRNLAFSAVASTAGYQQEHAISCTYLT
jgi:hypothetical protein